MKKKNLFLFLIAGICVLAFAVAVPALNRANVLKVDVDLNTSEWNTIYAIDSFDTTEGLFLGIVNDANNDDEICIRVLDENNEIVYEPFSVALGEQKELNFMKNGYIIQAKSVEIDANYRIAIIKKGMR